ncbi:subtilisin-like protease [Renibacterium salmoninarum ATCC 33209]|uniref:Subtilisin-like protease n=3 Tax=Renibacterium salmoninarum TaxID=1646 RepID=A9WKQ2_RENSM|nr:subtilisin-like protease [Renibacterium salmoninarum ATCC 33209]
MKMNRIHGKATTLFLVSLMSIASLSAASTIANAADAQPGQTAIGDKALATPLAVIAEASAAPQSALAATVREQLGSAAQLSDAAGKFPVEISVARGSLQKVADGLKGQGLKELSLVESGPLPTIYTSVTAQELALIGKLPGVKRVAPADSGQSTDAGSVTSQGDAAIKGPEARQTTAAKPVSANGAGVYVGVISDSFNIKTVQVDDPDNPGQKKAVPGLKAAQDSGDLPATVKILREGSATATDEGQAMAQIIYDEAPGITKLAFSTSGGIGKAAAINSLVNEGVKVIADDIYNLSDPVYQDGAAAIAANNAIAQGVIYVASAGNRCGNSAFETAPNFVADPDAQEADPNKPVAPELEDFGNGVTTKKIATIPVKGKVNYDLQWKEGWGNAQSDLGLRLVDSTGALLTATSYSDADNVASGIPQEGVSYINTTGAAVDVYAQI